MFDFDGVFTDNTVIVSQTGEESVICSRADGLGLDMLRSACSTEALQLETLIISTETNPVVAARARKLQITCAQGVGDKLAYAEQLLLEAGAKWDDAMFVGNDLNDLPLLKAVKHSCCPSDAHDEVKQVCKYVLPKRGGDGLVRYLIEELLNRQQEARQWQSS